MRTCHHLHGGLGMDISYPLPRYSALLTDLVALVGGADDRLERLSWREQRGPERGWPEQGPPEQSPSDQRFPEQQLPELDSAGLTATEAADA